jgi:RNA polymerase sigma factor (sigma-70 family)
METTDKQLLLACRRGDENAWDALIARYQRLVYAIPRRAGLDTDEIAEVFQEVFATLIEKLDEIQQPDRLQAWLVTTARRKTWRIISKKKAGPLSTDDESIGNEVGKLAVNDLLPDAVLLKLEEQHQVRTALAAIDDRCRNLLTMLFYTNEPPAYSEIAMKLGVREGSIGPMRARCLEKLMKLINK